MTDFTENQIKAMNERDCNLLVSASAGSGKTTVLISRVVNLILGKDTTPDGGRVDYKGEKASLDNMVICTYTRAAAADMRDKLQTALIAEEEKGNKTASEQLELLPSAEISTIHSWCQRLLKNYFYAVGLDPAFDLLDERESAAMLNETIDEVIDARIEKSEETFVTLYEILMSKRSDFALKEILGRIYTFSRAQADPERYLSETAFFGVDNPEVIEQEYKISVERFMARYRAIFTDLLDKCEKYGLSTRIKQLTSAIAYTNGNADKIENKGTNKIPELIPLDDEVEAVVKKFREKIKSIKENSELPPANNRKFVEQIVSMVQEVDERFSRKKQRKAKLDYSDLEHYTVKLLKTEYADEIRKRYRYVFVDEYQDVNPLQEQIILA
ncbi:MAG: UvrD-helicase domain-containing protein, partial [Clostridia bacterium]|nr:UvrD-helicase domain-containing protein [Clostridia bacterium]